MIQSDFTGSETEGRPRRRLPSLLFLLLGTIILGAVLLLVWQVLAARTPHSNSVGTSSSIHGGMSAQSKQARFTPPEVIDYVKQHIAQGLHLSVDQLIARLQAGEDIQAIAAQQNLSADQWHTLEINTYQAAYNRQVSEGKMTRQDVDSNMSHIRSYPPAELNALVTSNFLGGSPQG